MFFLTVCPAFRKCRTLNCYRSKPGIIFTLKSKFFSIEIYFAVVNYVNIRLSFMV